MQDSRNYTLKALLPIEHIQYVPSVSNWEEAIRLVAEPLLAREIIPFAYLDEAIRNVHKYGPYIVLKEGFALPHASVKVGGGELALSLLILEEPIAFSHEDFVWVLLMLVPKDEESHLVAIAEFIDKIDQDDWFGALKSVLKRRNFTFNPKGGDK